MKILKEFALGILWAALTPLLLVVIAVVAVFAIGNFFYEFVLMVIHFFQGKKLFPPFEEDIKAYKILKRSIEEEEKKEEAKPAPAGPVYVQANYFTGTPPGMPPFPGDPRIGNQSSPYGVPPSVPPVPPPPIENREVPAIENKEGGDDQ